MNHEREKRMRVDFRRFLKWGVVIAAGILLLYGLNFIAGASFSDGKHHWLEVLSGNVIETTKDSPFRSVVGEQYDRKNYLRFQISFGDNILHWVRVPIEKVAVRQRPDGKPVTTISGWYKRHSKRSEWLEATIYVPTENDLRTWIERLQFYNFDVPVRIVPDSEFR